MRIFKWFGRVLLILLVITGVAVTVILTTDIMVHQFKEEEPALFASDAQIQDTIAADLELDTLRVMTYNIKFGGGRIDFWFDCHGDRVVMDSLEVLGNLAAIANLIRELKPHILLIQEAEWGSNRAAFINQVQYLLDSTHLVHAAYGSQWEAYVPSQGLGSVNSGNAVLSVFPLAETATRYALPQMEDQDALTRFFYLRRCVLEVPVLLGPRDTLWVLNSHLEAYDKDGTRRKQLEILQQIALKHNHLGHKLIIGGDFNTMPPGTTQWRDFDDEACVTEDFQTSVDSTELEWLMPLYLQFQECIPLNDYKANQQRYFTHTTRKDGFWNRRLDYLFTNLRWAEGSGMVYQNPQNGGFETMPLSDHAPIGARLVLKNN